MAQQLCHKAVRKIAQEMANEAYECFAHDNMFRKNYPSRAQFVIRHWKNFVGNARTSLVDVLATSNSDIVKEEVFDIMMKDRLLQEVQPGAPLR